MTGRERYGIDAPKAVRNLGLTGAALVAGVLVPGTIRGAAIAHALWPTGISLLAAAAWMVASSLWIKKVVMQSLLGERQWRGDEKVLDVGCGRGLVSIAAAKHVPNGMVHAIDLWQAADLSGNGPENICANAVIAGVADRLIVETGDARALPYGDATFDVVASMTTIHNIPNKKGRQMAIAEVWRVLRPGGQVLIFDIRHARSYLRQLRQLGAVDTCLKGPILLWGPIGWRFSAFKPML